MHVSAFMTQATYRLITKVSEFEKIFVFALLILVLLVVIIFISDIYHLPIPITFITPTSTEDTPLTHSINNDYGFSIDYPAEYALRQYSSTLIGIGTGENNEFHPAAYVHITTHIPYTDEQARTDAILQELLAVCAPQHTPCLNAAASIPVRSAGEIAGTKWYMNTSTDQILKGPFYTFGISDKTLLIIYPPQDTPPEEVNKDVLRAIAKSVSAVLPRSLP